VPVLVSIVRSRFSTFRFGRPTRRDFGLIGLSVAAVGASYFATAESHTLSTGTTCSVAIATAMYGRLAMGRWPSAAQLVATAALVAMLGAPPRLIGVLLITGLAASELIARHARRSAILRVGAWLALVACLTSMSGVVAAALISPRAALVEAVAAAIGAFLSAPLLLTLAPLAEGLFGHVTRLTMSEWLSYEHPLLRQLASAAPGTFQHSVNVGVLADAAAGAIGADALLARVGGLYHDVGKMNAPAYFIENQHGDNPHEALDPTESARILRAHVLDGVELVHQHRMGERIADFVREHHGSGEMRLLREKAEALAQSFSEDAYRYPGPRPRSRETGILMIADQLEATARSKAPGDDAECDAIVRSTIERIVSEGQLDESGLTKGDLALAERGFSRALQAMYHRRLPYPSSGDGTRRRRVIFPTRPRRSAAS
jgi:putative nucleotidyltransferase with HDIG domain